MTQYVPTKPNGCYLDYTYCSNVNCENKCGHKMSDEIKKVVQNDRWARYAVSDFCAEDE